MAKLNPYLTFSGNCREAMNYYKVYDKVKDKLVYGESISQTNQYITSGSADIGFTAKSIVLSDEMKGKGSWVDQQGSIQTYQPRCSNFKAR